MKNIIIALDYTNQNQAKELISKLNPELCRVKVGKALFTTAGPQFIEYLHKLGFEVFLDLKYHDIPNTVREACRACADLGVFMLTVHTMGGLEMLQAAKEGISEVPHAKTKVMGVTVLTSFDENNLKSIGISNSLRDQVIILADLAVKARLDGIVCSAHEVSLIKSKFENQLEILTPGIRLDSNKNNTAHHDQKRVMTPNEALAAGSNYLVIGRAITQSPDPAKTLEEIYNGLN